ncbi:MAG: sensor domain-containing diguanylate cyclase [Planctomycetota bacterium]
MIEPVKSPDERVRLAALHALGILDTPAEERFDRLTRLACRIFGTPMAMVSLVDENRQWFKSAQGVSVAETPRATSFCGHGILQQGVMVVPDALKDRRFANNPLVMQDPRVRFYAGQPLRSADGKTLGMFCVVDRRPRKMSPADLQALRDLAAIAQQELAVSALSRAQKEILTERGEFERKALTDPLTRLWNRGAILDILDREIARSRREHIPLGVIMADIDHFKRINDTRGHPAGDDVLRWVSVHLRAAVRGDDAVGRYGGEEFILVLGNCDRATGVSIVERLRAYVAAEPCLPAEGKPLPVTISAGLVVAPPDRTPSAEILVAAADKALYRAKRGGRNRVEVTELDGKGAESA